MNKRCKFKEGKWNCGSYAFNLYKDDIDQGDLCDVHYWQGRAHRAEAQPEQEPVETYIHEYRSQPHPNDFGISKSHWWKAKQYADALYTSPPQRTWVGLDWLPEHKCGLYLSHNEHRDVYEPIEEFYDAKDFISQEEWHKAVKEDSVWVLQWYPNTPIGFNRIAASTLQAIKTKLKELNT